jgi:TonB family protein
MSPLSLVFSSDEETSRRLGQALRELELEVEPCPEIFAAVEKLTSRSFDIIVADWDEGLEASFLLKTARELKSNKGAFTLAIASADAAAAALQVGANLVLSKPIYPDKVKYALLTCDEFLSHLRTWLPRLGFPAGEEPARQVVENELRPAPLHGNYAPRPYQSVPLPRSSVAASSLSASPPSPTLGSGLFRGSGITTLFQQDVSKRRPASKTRKGRSPLLRGTAIGVAFLSVGYVFSQPLRSEAMAASVARIYERALAKTQNWLHAANDDTDALAEVAQNVTLRPARSRTTRIQMNAVSNAPAQVTTTSATVPPEPPEIEATPQQIAAGPSIPESLKFPIQTAAMHTVAERITPSLLGALEPVNLSEDLSQKLLLERVLPSYPEKALQAGLQGPVVLQAWIGRDGTIRELKLIHGSFLLGQAAYQAVKQWRYKPYLLNGHAVEAQTLVTVDFKLPQ